MGAARVMEVLSVIHPFMTGPAAATLMPLEQKCDENALKLASSSRLMLAASVGPAESGHDLSWQTH